MFPNQLTTLLVAERNHDTIAPITPGKAAAALPARFASNLARLCSCFLTHSLAPPWDGGFDCWNNSLNDRPHTNVIAQTLTLVMPCSLNNVFSLSPRVESSFKT